MKQKYILLKDDKIQFKHPINKRIVTLQRICALQSFYCFIEPTNLNLNRKQTLIREGDLGGYVESISNLDQNDSSWCNQFVKIFDKGFVTGDSFLTGFAAVFEMAIVHNSKLMDYCRIYGKAELDQCMIKGKSDICGFAKVNKTTLNNACRIDGNAVVDECMLHGGSHISDHAVVKNSELFDTSRIYGFSEIRQCTLKHSTLIRDRTLFNETVSREISLEITTGED